MTGVQNLAVGANESRSRLHIDPVTPRQILCATDLSPRSQRAVTRAMQVAKRLDGQLTLLHVADAEDSRDSLSSLRHSLDYQLAAARIQLRRHAVVQLRTGSYVDTVATVAKQISADVILLSAPARKLRAPLIGSTAERLIALSGCPALIVNRDPRVRYGAVVIAAELSDAFIRIVRVAASLKFLESKAVSVVHGFDSAYRGPLYASGFDLHATRRYMEAWEKAALERLHLNFEAAGVESAGFRIVFQQARPRGALLRVVRSVQPDLLIVGTKDRSMFNRVVRGSVASDAIRSLECDILVACRGSETAGLLH